MTTATTAVDEIAFFDALASAMRDDPERYEHLGDLQLDLAIVMRRPTGDHFRVRLSFDGIACEGVAEIAPSEEKRSDCWLEGDLEQWQAMFANIREHGGAIGEWSLNTLTLFGDRISLHATDPVGEDRFHRFNQTLQEFVDGAARVGER